MIFTYKYMLMIFNIITFLILNLIVCIFSKKGLYNNKNTDKLLNVVVVHVYFFLLGILIVY